MNLSHTQILTSKVSQAGQLDKALGTLDAMPIKVSSTLWGSLLLACQIHQNVSLAETAVERFVELEADDSGVCVLLSNTCRCRNVGGCTESTQTDGGQRIEEGSWK